MSVTYVVEDPWEAFMAKMASVFKDGVEIKVVYDGIEASVSLDAKALERIASVLEKGTPLEVALGIDLPKILESLDGESLELTVKTSEFETTCRIRGEALNALREAMKHNPLDGDTLVMISRMLKVVVA